MTKVAYPTVLAFERKFDFSDVYFEQKHSLSAETFPILLTEKTVLGTISHKSAKDADKKSANIQRVDVAQLDSDKDQLVATLNFKVLPFTGRPWSCNEPAFQDKLVELISDYLNDNQNIKVLADRYAYNILNARWLWRNRISAKNVQIEIIKDGEDKPFITIEDAKLLSLQEFPSSKEVDLLASEIIKGLKGEAFTNFKVVATAHIGEGHEVYPSQEFVQEASSAKGGKSKVLYTTNDTAGMHSQKAGNAIRTIDTWYENANFPIAIEPFGTVSTMGEAFRAKDNFYKFFEDWVVKKDKEIAIEQKHYIVANLLRGGVFGGKS